MKKVLFISSDAGGTLALVPVVRELLGRGFNVQIFASGPAILIWQKENPISNCISLKDSIDESDAIDLIHSYHPDLVVSGAGAYNMIEHTFRRVAFQLGIFCFALVDGWFNFKVRFQRENNGRVTYSFPDLIGVMNEASRAEMIECGGEANKVIVVGAPHIEETVQFVKTVSEIEIIRLFTTYNLRKNVKSFVFFSAPDDERETTAFPPLGYTADVIRHEIVRGLIYACTTYNKPVQLIVKPHPNESYEKLSDALQREDTCPLLDCRIIEDCTTKELLCISDAVFGMTTTALMEAAYAGKPAISVQIGRNLEFHPDRYFANISGITPVYDVQMLRLVIGNLFLKPKNTIDNSIYLNFNHAVSRVVEVLVAKSSR